MKTHLTFMIGSIFFFLGDNKIIIYLTVDSILDSMKYIFFKICTLSFTTFQLDFSWTLQPLNLTQVLSRTLLVHPDAWCDTDHRSSI
jgi:hypothetical protein